MRKTLRRLGLTFVSSSSWRRREVPRTTAPNERELRSHFRSFTHKATEHLLATSSANNDDMNSADTILQWRLCDGVSTWAGQLPPAKLTPPPSRRRVSKPIR